MLLLIPRTTRMKKILPVEYIPRQISIFSILTYCSVVLQVQGLLHRKLVLATRCSPYRERASKQGLALLQLHFLLARYGIIFSFSLTILLTDLLHPALRIVENLELGRSGCRRFSFLNTVDNSSFPTAG